MPISMNSPSASIVATPAGADCSSSASCSTRSLRHPLDIGLHALALKHKTTTCSGHCTQAATPLSVIHNRQASIHRQARYFHGFGETAATCQIHLNPINLPTIHPAQKKAPLAFVFSCCVSDI